MSCIVLQIKAVNKDTFEPLLSAFNDSFIAYSVKYKFGNIADIEIPEQDLQVAMSLLASADRYKVIKQTFN